MSGLDLIDATQPGNILAIGSDSSLDGGTKTLKFKEMLEIGQETFTSIEKVLHVYEPRYTSLPKGLHVRSANSDQPTSALTDQSSQGTLWVAKEAKSLQTDRKDSDQPARTDVQVDLSLRRVHVVGNAVAQLIL